MAKASHMEMANFESQWRQEILSSAWKDRRPALIVNIPIVYLQTHTSYHYLIQRERNYVGNQFYSFKTF